MLPNSAPTPERIVGRASSVCCRTPTAFRYQTPSSAIEAKLGNSSVSRSPSDVDHRCERELVEDQHDDRYRVADLVHLRKVARAGKRDVARRSHRQEPKGEGDQGQGGVVDRGLDEGVPGEQDGEGDTAAQCQGGEQHRSGVAADESDQYRGREEGEERADDDGVGEAGGAGAHPAQGEHRDRKEGGEDDQSDREHDYVQGGEAPGDEELGILTEEVEQGLCEGEGADRGQ